jgi:hypothetical protein
MIKMSLVAAVAVAGLTSTASAANLADAVKDTKFTGYVRYRLNTDHEATGTTGEANEESKAVFKFTTPVNDMITANTKIVALADTQTGTNGSDTKGQTVAPMNVTEANFVIKAGSATLIAGLQTSQSPFMANNGDTRSHGLTALVPAGAVTVAAAHYTTTTVVGNTTDISAVIAGAELSAAQAPTQDITALGAIAKLGAANVEAWYAQIAKTDVTTMAVLGSVKAGPADVAFHYASLDTGLDEVDDVSNTQISAKLKAGGADIMLAYAMTGEDSGDVTVDGDVDGKLILATTSTKIDTRAADATVMVADVSAPVAGYTVGAQLLSGEAGDTDLASTSFRVAKKLSKNFTVSGWYAMEEKGADMTNSRIEVLYTF